MTLMDGGEGNTVASYDPARHVLVLVTTNYDTNGQQITYDLSNFSSVSGARGGLVNRWATETDGGGDNYTEHFDTHLSDKSFRSWFPANTVQTFEVDRVDL